jgi:hypothetical protein
MQITSESLNQYAESTVNRVTSENRNIIVAYMVGSVVMESNPLLGGTTDIDLVFIHSGDPPVEREIQALSDEVHLDVTHHPQKKYTPGRELRTHPWMGPTIFNAKILFDPRHFMDFVQAAVRGLFYRADYVIQRTQPLIEEARGIWFDLQTERPDPGPEVVSRYLRALDHAGNAIAGLSGPPLAERRFLLQFLDRAEAINQPGLYAGLLGLLGGPRVDGKVLTDQLPAWEAALDALPRDETPPGLHADRRAYYLKAFEAILGSGQPLNILWPLLTTWTLAAQALPPEHPAIEGWGETCSQLGLQGDDFYERVTALDAFLDTVETTMENWATEQGV